MQGLSPLFSECPPSRQLFARESAASAFPVPGSSQHQQSSGHLDYISALTQQHLASRLIPQSIFSPWTSLQTSTVSQSPAHLRPLESTVGHTQHEKLTDLLSASSRDATLIMSTFSYFFDKLSPETRVTIYGFVFGASGHIKRDRVDDGELGARAGRDERLCFYGLPTAKGTARIGVETSICAVNEQVRGEALETLFNEKIVRLRLEDLFEHRGYDYFNFIRRLEIVDCIGSVWYMKQA